MPESQIEMFWQCGISTCKTVNRGRDMKCKSCGKPKGDEPYLMPEDIEFAPAITAPDLLAKAKAGANWKCKYCESAQRRGDGLCVECGSNQTDSSDRRKTVEPDPFAAGKSPYREPTARPYYPDEMKSSVRDSETSPVSHSFAPPPAAPWLTPNRVVVAAALLAMIGLIVFAFWPNKVNTSVSTLHWKQVIEVDQYKLRHKDGFNEDRPADALNIHSLGPRYHHTDHVLDHYETVRYTEREACGQTCSPVPKDCRTTPKSCTSNKNGFATCTGGDRVCTGGGQSCVTRYCDRAKTREEPRYVDIPRYAPYYAWDVWRWAYGRDVILSGSTTETVWPTHDALKLCHDALPCSEGEDEREGKHYGEYHVVLAGSKESFKIDPKDETEFRLYPMGSRWELHVDRMGIIHDKIRK